MDFLKIKVAFYAILSIVFICRYKETARKEHLIWAIFIVCGIIINIVKIQPLHIIFSAIMIILLFYNIYLLKKNKN